MHETCLILIKYNVEGDLKKNGDEDISDRVDHKRWDQMRYTVYYPKNLKNLLWFLF